MTRPDPHGGPDDRAGSAAFSYGRIWWLAVGFLGVQLAFATYNAFLPLLYRPFFDSRAVIGLLMGTDNLVGIVLIPLIGASSDRITSTLGRRLPFIAIAVPLAALTLAAIPFAAALLWTLILTEVAFTAAMHAYRAPMAALIIDHTPPTRRSTSSGIAQLMGGVGVLVSFSVLSLLFDIDPRLTFGAAAVVLLLSLAVLLWRAERFPVHIDNAPVASLHPVRDAVDGVRVLLQAHTRGQLLLLCAMLAAYIGFAGLQAMFPIYGVETLGLSEGRAAFLLTSFAGSFLVSALVAGMIGTRIGKLPTMLLGLGSLPVIYLAAIPVDGPTALAGLLVAAGFAWPLFAVPAVALIGDLGGRDRVGFYLGIYYVFTMLGQMMGPFVLGATMDLAGNRAMWAGAAAVSLLAFGLVWAGRVRLGGPPERFADLTSLDPIEESV